MRISSLTDESSIPVSWADVHGRWNHLRDVVGGSVILGGTNPGGNSRLLQRAYFDDRPNCLRDVARTVSCSEMDPDSHSKNRRDLRKPQATQQGIGQSESVPHLKLELGGMNRESRYVCMLAQPSETRPSSLSGFRSVALFPLRKSLRFPWIGRSITEVSGVIRLLLSPGIYLFL